MNVKQQFKVDRSDSVVHGRTFEVVKKAYDPSGHDKLWECRDVETGEVRHFYDDDPHLKPVK